MYTFIQGFPPQKNPKWSHFFRISEIKIDQQKWRSVTGLLPGSLPGGGRLPQVIQWIFPPLMSGI